MSAEEARRDLRLLRTGSSCLLCPRAFGNDPLPELGGMIVRSVACAGLGVMLLEVVSPRVPLWLWLR